MIYWYLRFVLEIDDVGACKVGKDVSFKTGIEITSVSPAIGSSEGGTEITIKGKNFLKTQIAFATDNAIIELAKVKYIYNRST